MKSANTSYTLMLVTLIGLLFILSAGTSTMAQCSFDKAAPSLENARTMFKMTNYKCAEEELSALLKSDSLDYRTRADGHMLLAQVYWAMIRNDSDKKEKVLAEFVKAFREFQDWRGELDIQSDEFLSLMEEAKEQAKTQKPATPEVTVVTPPSGCPSKTVPIISTAAFLGSGALFIIGSSSASSKWDDYEADPLHPTSLYDDYKSANNIKKIGGALTVVTGVATVYFWYKYMKDKKACKASSPAYSVHYEPSNDMVVLTYSF